MVELLVWSMIQCSSAIFFYECHAMTDQGIFQGPKKIKGKSVKKYLINFF